MSADPRVNSVQPRASARPLWESESNLTTYYLPLVSREWKNGSNSSYNCTPFLHSLLTKGKTKASCMADFAAVLF